MKYKIENIKSDISSSKRNKLINNVKKDNYNYLFLVDETVKVKDDKVYNDYISLMKRYNLSISFYGFGANMNRIFNNKPNPISEIIINERVPKVVLNRYACDSFICIDLTKNKTIFDENLKCLGFEHFLHESSKNKGIPFHGFFFDIENSYNRFEQIGKRPTIDKQTYVTDMEYLKKIEKPLELDSNIDNVVNYIFDSIKEEL